LAVKFLFSSRPSTTRKYSIASLENSHVLILVVEGDTGERQIVKRPVTTVLPCIYTLIA